MTLSAGIISELAERRGNGQGLATAIAEMGLPVPETEIALQRHHRAEMDAAKAKQKQRREVEVEVDFDLGRAFRAAAERMEELIREATPVEILVTHYFAKGPPGHGIYGREIAIPKGTVLTGKIHKYAQLNIMSKGDLSVLTEEGVKRVQAPFAIVSPPGTKRIAYAHEDTVWTTVHGTDETDLEKIEDLFIAQTEDEFMRFLAEQKLIEVKP